MDAAFLNGPKHRECQNRHTHDVQCVTCCQLMDRDAGQEPRSKILESKDPCLPMAQLYPKYYKPIPEQWDYIDTYRVNVIFPVDDESGCILHARKKLLVPGTRTGGKSMRADIKEARDTLNRWLDENPE